MAANRPKSIKKVDFAAQPHLILVFESGSDEFTFDNRWPDGSPKVSCHKEKLFIPRRRRRSNWCSPIEDEVIAHARALDLLRGQELPLPAARLLFHDGRQPRFEPSSGWLNYHDDNPEDTYYELAESELVEESLPNYAAKELVIWKENFVCRRDGAKLQVATIPHEEATVRLAPN